MSLLVGFFDKDLKFLALSSMNNKFLLWKQCAIDFSRIVMSIFFGVSKTSRISSLARSSFILFSNSLTFTPVAAIQRLYFSTSNSPLIFLKDSTVFIYSATLLSFLEIPSFFIRLSRGSGLTGLSSLQEISEIDNIIKLY